MKKRFCVIFFGMLLCLSVCACGVADETNSDAFADAKSQILDSSSDVSDSSIMQNNGIEQNDQQMVANISNNDVMNFADYDGLVYSGTSDSSYLSLLDDGDKLTGYLVIDQDINGNSGFFDGAIDLYANQCSSSDGNFYFRSVSSVDNSITVDFDFYPDGSVMVSANKDDGGYASCNLICPDFVKSADSTSEGSGADGQLGNSALATFVGEYKNSNGDSFIIEQDNGTGEYKISQLKLYSAEGWPEETDRDGVRFYDTPTIVSIVGDVNDMIVVETISQYTVANGTFYLGVNGAADVKYTGFSSSAPLNGNYSGYFTK